MPLLLAAPVAANASEVPVLQAGDRLDAFYDDLCRATGIRVPEPLLMPATCCERCRAFLPAFWHLTCSISSRSALLKASVRSFQLRTCGKVSETVISVQGAHAVLPTWINHERLSCYAVFPYRDDVLLTKANGRADTVHPCWVVDAALQVAHTVDSRSPQPAVACVS